ncbi:hypothetical protein [Fulvimarina sp. MAC3]|uniref:hypothetical protein n=1 Tax=Fulvimarina sp. MAC3 TaxID=3148887 RepID=UPI0031FDC476
MIALLATTVSGSAQRGLEDLLQNAPENQVSGDGNDRAGPTGPFTENMDDVLVIDGNGHELDPNSAGVADTLRRLDEAVKALEAARNKLPGGPNSSTDQEER